MDRVIGADQKVSSDISELVSRIKHQVPDTQPVTPIHIRDVIGERRRMHGNLGMRVRSEQLRTLQTDGAIAKSCTFSRTANDSNVLSHRGRIPLLIELDNIAIFARSCYARISNITGRPQGWRAYRS